MKTAMRKEIQGVNGELPNFRKPAGPALCHAVGVGGRGALNLFIQLCSQLFWHSTIQASPQDKAKPQLVVGIKGELALADGKSPSADLHHKSAAGTGNTVHHAGGKP